MVGRPLNPTSGSSRSLASSRRGRFRLIGAALFVIAIVVAGSARADPAGDFIARYVAAVNAGAEDDIVALFHPATRACMVEANQDFFDYVLANELKRSIPDDYRLTVTPVADDETLLMAGMLAYPARPSHTLQIDFENGAYSGTTIYSYAIDDGGAWHTVIGCPTPEAVAMFREARVRALEQEEHARELAAQAPADLRAEIEALMTEGKRIAAIKRYAEAASVDLALARDVVELIAGATD